MAWFERPRPALGTEGDVVWRRAVAVIIDIVLLGIATSILSGILVRAGLPAVGGFVSLLISFAYYIYLEGNYGQTIGKMALDVVVVTEDGTDVDYRAAALRTVLRLVDVLPVLYLVGIVAVYVTDRNQRLGDMVADTVVVRVDEAGADQL